MTVLKHVITNKCTLAGQWSVVTLEFSTVSVSVIQKFDSVGQASLTPRPGSSMPRNNLAHTRYKIQDTRPLFTPTSSRCCWSTRQNCQNWEQRGIHEHTLIIEVNWVWHQFCSCSSLEEDPIWSKSGSQLGPSCKVYGWAHVELVDVHAVARSVWPTAHKPMWSVWLGLITFSSTTLS